MNEWFAANKIDLWLLAFQTDFTMVFIQRLSELDEASKKLEKMGYYENYTKEDLHYFNLSKKKETGKWLELKRKLCVVTLAAR